MKLFKTVLPFLAVLLVAGCVTHSNVVPLTPHDSGREIHVAVGQMLLLELPANHTAGYSWRQPPLTNSVLELVGTPSYMHKSSATIMVGRRGVELWRYRAMQPGKENLTLEYGRPWETNTAPVQVVSFKIKVGK